MEDKVLFRTKGRGYNKDDVNEYIASENKKFAQIDLNYRNLLREKDQIIGGFNDEVIRKNREIAELRDDLSQKDAIIEEYKGISEKNAEEIEELNMQIAEFQAQIKSSRSDFDFELPDEAVSLLEEDPNLKYEQIQSRVDEILNHAKMEAIKIINAAIETSHRYEVTQSDIENIKKDISGRSAGIINELKKSLRLRTK